MRKDGTRFWAHVVITAVHGEDGGLRGFSTVTRDRTERRRSEAKFEGLLEAAPDALLGVDACGLIQLVNTQAERLFGYPRGELLGRPIETLVPDGARAAHPRHRTRYFTDPQVRVMGAGADLTGRRKDGTEFPAEISLSSIDTEDGVVVTAAVRDATERRAFEAVVADARDLAEQAARSRQEFLANMSHEIPHSDERRHRHDEPAAGHDPGPSAARLCRDGTHQRGAPADDHQRHPRLRQDRRREAGVGGVDVRGPGPGCGTPSI